jgi:hypothetical protein
VREDGIWRAATAWRFFPRPNWRGVRRLSFTAFAMDNTWDLSGALSTASYSVQPFGVALQSGDELNLIAQRREDVPTDSFEIIPGVTLAPGRYGWNRGTIEIETAERRSVTAAVAASAGGFYDGTSTSFEYELTGRLAPHVIAAVEGGWEWVRMSAGRFTAQEQRLRLDYAYSPRLNTTLFLQWENESKRLAVNARLHWIPRPGVDAYLVWNSTWPTVLAGGVPWQRPLRAALAAKFVYYFRV